jgi:predicted patatin/cPLA2 family phospholipase
MKKAMSKIAQINKEELSAQKVELNLINNLKSDLDRIEYKSGIVDKLINEFKQASSQLKNKYEAEFRGVMMDIEESQSTAKKYVEDIVNVSKEIGADTSKVVNDYRAGKSLGDKALQRADNYFRIIAKL